jgi:hypothetical protein
MLGLVAQAVSTGVWKNEHSVVALNFSDSFARVARQSCVGGRMHVACPDALPHPKQQGDCDVTARRIAGCDYGLQLGVTTWAFLVPGSIAFPRAISAAVTMLVFSRSPASPAIRLSQ